MENSISNNWIDLSGLPRFEGLTKHKNINWKASPGYDVKFCYNGINSTAKILSMNVKTRRLRVYIDGWTAPDGEDVVIQAFQNCQLHKLYNKIAVLTPEMIPYLDDENDAYRFAPYCNEKLPMHCLECGTKKMCAPSNFMYKGLVCEACGDGVSYPNKFMFNILSQLKVDFINEISRTTQGFKWCDNYRYDFYFICNKKQYFVEMDGHFHDYNCGRNNDSVKDELARRHDISLIRIDCRYNKLPFDYIKQNILDSELADLFDFSGIDWRQCDEYASNSLLRVVCDMWENKNMSVGEIMAETQFSKTTVREYLLRGVRLGFCPSYNKYESRKRMGITHNKYIALCKGDQIKCVFLNARELERISIQIGIPKFYANVVRKACRGDLISYHGLNFKDITKEEYEQYKMINNEVVLKKEMN
jgi:very-short-patch-repair endonuclease